MPAIQVEGFGLIDAPVGKKLVLVLENNGVDILHRCGGNARCVTCRVEVLSGDAGPMSDAEKMALTNKGIEDPTIRLSCQMHVQNDLTVKPVMTAIASGMDPGPTPHDN